MKPYQIATTLLGIFLFSIISCSKTENGKTDPDPKPDPEKPQIEIPEQYKKMEILSQDTTITISFSTSESWTAATHASWVSIKPSNGKAGTINATITFNKNESYDDRRSLIVINSDTATDTISLNQKSFHLTFKSKGFSEIKLIKNGNPPSIDLEFRKSGGNWEPFLLENGISLSDGESVQMRAAIENEFMNTGDNYYHFAGTGDVSVSGNFLTLAEASGHPTTYEPSFARLFKDFEALTDASSLVFPDTSSCPFTAMFRNCINLKKGPKRLATKCKEDSYFQMFDACFNLIEAPELPLTRLTQNCYCLMFSGCRKLPKAPKLPALVLTSSCYAAMFFDCRELQNAPELPAIELAYGCYNQMFVGCLKLKKAPELPAEKLADNCYFHMFRSCTLLQSSPILPAKQLTPNCYESMFEDCKQLQEVTAYFTDTDFSNDALKNWLKGVSSNGTFFKNSEATWDRNEVGMPTTWNVIDAE